MATFVTTEHEGAVALVTIDNPPLNALSAALLAELEAEVDRLDADDATRAIVLQGGGERAFVAGADIKEFPSLRETGGGEGGAARGLHSLGHRMDAARHRSSRRSRASASAAASSSRSAATSGSAPTTRSSASPRSSSA